MVEFESFSKCYGFFLCKSSNQFTYALKTIPELIMITIKIKMIMIMIMIMIKMIMTKMIMTMIIIIIIIIKDNDNDNDDDDDDDNFSAPTRDPRNSTQACHTLK